MNWSDLSNPPKTEHYPSEITPLEVNSFAIQQMMPYGTPDQALPYDLSTQWHNPQYQQLQHEQNQPQQHQYPQENQEQQKHNQPVKQQQEQQLKVEQYEKQPKTEQKIPQPKPKQEEQQKQGTVDCNECSRVFPTFPQLVKHLVNLLEFILLEISTSQTYKTFKKLGGRYREVLRHYSTLQFNFIVGKN